jgi:hypothetical protein
MIRNELGRNGPPIHLRQKRDHERPHALAPFIVAGLAAILWFLIIYAGLTWLF